MLGPILALVLSTASASDVDPATSLVLLPEPLPAGSAQTLPRQLDYYGHYGSAAIGEATDSQLAALEARGIVVRNLGTWPDDATVIVTPRRNRPAPGVRILGSTTIHNIVAVPNAVRAEHPEWFAGCGHTQAHVTRSSWLPPTPFKSPARKATATSDSLASSLGQLGPQAALSVDPRVATLVAPITGANISATVDQLSSYFTRRADSAQILQARDWIIGELNAIPGIDSVTTQTFDNSLAPNIIAEITGSVNPDRVVILGAHYDSINLSGSQFTAPGADDNASGSGGLLEAARVLSEGEFENTIRFVWFSAEEFGLVGAGEYADFLNSQPSIEALAMLNMDMIAHRTNGDAFDVDFVTNNTDAALTAFCIEVTEAYTPTLGINTGILSAGSSDHAAFQARGIPAAFFFEDLDSFSSVIHTSGDTQNSSANDYVLAERIATAVSASAALLAEPVDLILAHTEIADTVDAGGPYAASVTATSLNGSPVTGVDLNWSVDGGAVQTVAMIPGNGVDEWVAVIPGVAPSGSVDYHFVGTNAEGQQDWLPEGSSPGASTFDFEVGLVTNIFAQDFEGPNDAGWSHVQLAQQDDWQRGAPQGNAGDPGSAFEGSSVWGNDLGDAGFNGEYQSNVNNYLESPVIDCSAASDVQLRFARWLTVEDATFDQATLSVSGTQVWQNPVGGGSDHLLDTDWTVETYDISSIADGNSNVRVRFQLESDGGLEFGGWNIDDFSLRTVDDGVAPALVTDTVFVSAAAGASVSFALDDPALANRNYAILMGFSGSTPGTPIGSTVLPVNFDALTSLGISLLGSPVLPGWTGTLSPSGTASASLVSPAMPGMGIEGLELTFAFVVTGPINAASNATSVTYVP